MADKSRKDRVGYGHPPKHTQYPPGVSGNPSGRPRGSNSFQSDLRDELRALIKTPEGEITKQRAVLKALISNAMEGDPRAMAVLLSTCARLLLDESDPNHGRPLSAEEYEILREFVTQEEKRRAAAKHQAPQIPATQSATTTGVTNGS